MAAAKQKSKQKSVVTRETTLNDCKKNQPVA